jgi:hypothetical protein
MEQVLQYYSGGRKQRLELQGIFQDRQRFGGRRDAAPPMRFPMRPQSGGAQVLRLLEAQPRQLIVPPLRHLRIHDHDPTGWAPATPPSFPPKPSL